MADFLSISVQDVQKLCLASGGQSLRFLIKTNKNGIDKTTELICIVVENNPRTVFPKKTINIAPFIENQCPCKTKSKLSVTTQTTTESDTTEADFLIEELKIEQGDTEEPNDSGDSGVQENLHLNEQSTSNYIKTEIKSELEIVDDNSLLARISSTDDEQCTLLETYEASKESANDSLSSKSRDVYEESYKRFVKWKSTNDAVTSQSTLKIYFKGLIEKYKPSTIWSVYSKLKSTIQIHEKIAIDNYKELSALISKNARGYKGKKAKIFSTEQINSFLENAPDHIFLAMKVILIFGISGCCRKSEIYSVKVSHVRRQGDLFEVIIPDQKNKVSRRFVIDPKFVPIVEKYRSLRPKKAERENFFLQYHNGKCTVQVIGINAIGGMPKRIAKFLNLNNAEEYTGHSFRSTSATFYADTGATMLALQQHGGWKSKTVVKKYVNDSIAHKVTNAKRIAETIAGSESEESREFVPFKKIKIAKPQSFNLKDSSTREIIFLDDCKNFTDDCDE